MGPSTENLVDEIERELRDAGTPERALQERRYLKSDLTFLGTGVPAMRSIARSFLRRHASVDRITLLALVQALWARQVFELRSIAVEMLNARQDLLEAADIALIERLLRDSHTWALVDDLAANAAGGMVQRFPSMGATLDRWAQDGDFWIRRSALLALLVPLRAGCGDFERFARYADAMLEEQEFFIRKAIGWVLREVSKKRPVLVYEWLSPRAWRASGVTVREAVKYLLPEQRDAILAAYRIGRKP